MVTVAGSTGKVAIAQGKGRRENAKNATYYLRSETAKKLTDNLLILPRPAEDGKDESEIHNDSILGHLDELVHFHEDELRAFEFQSITVAGSGKRELEAKIRASDPLKQLPVQEKNLYQNGPWDTIELLEADGSTFEIRINREIHKSRFRIAAAVPCPDSTFGIAGVLPTMLYAIHPEDRSKLKGWKKEAKTPEEGSKEHARQLRALYRNFVRLGKHLMPDLAFIHIPESNSNVISNADAEKASVAFGSDDPVAADTMLAHLAGFPPFSLGHIYYLNRHQMGCGTFEALNPAVGNPDDIQLDFTPPESEEHRRKWKDVYLEGENPEEFEDLAFDEEDEEETTDEDQQQEKSAQDRIKDRLKSDGDDESESEEDQDPSGGPSAADRIKSMRNDDEEEEDSEEETEEESSGQSAADRIKSRLGDQDDSEESESEQTGTAPEEDTEEESSDDENLSAAEKIKQRRGEN